MHNKRKTCLIYVRKASNELDNGFSSLSNQEKRCREYASEQKLLVREVISDIASGNSISRKGLFTLFEALEKRYEIEYILVTNPSRLGRSSYQTIRELIQYISPKTKILSVDCGGEIANAYLEFTSSLKELKI